METIYIPEKYRILDGAALKMIAIVTMFIDHAAKGILYYGYLIPRRPVSQGTSLYTIYQFYRILRGIGRIAFPIFCFFLVQGFLYTRSRLKYALRLFIFALISEFPFDIALYQKWIYRSHQNVYFTLLIGVLMLWAFEWIGEHVRASYPMVFLQAAAVGALMYLSYIMHTDYNYKGLILILTFYLLRFHHPLAVTGGAVAMCWEWPYVLLAFPPLLLYNGKRGRQNKYFFYVFYPAHLLLIYFIRLFMLVAFPA